jgi:phytoene dehydrogenase-like protein
VVEAGAHERSDPPEAGDHGGFECRIDGVGEVHAHILLLISSLMPSQRADSGHYDVAIVGAGLAGLSAARAVHAAGRSVVIAEASDGIGGRVRTDEVDGFLLDRGFQVLLTAYPEVHRQLDVSALDLRAFDPGSLVWFGGRLHRVGDPFRMPSALLSSALAPIGSVADKLRLAALQRRVRRADPRDLLRGDDMSTIEALRTAHFSDAMIDRFFRPLLGGIQLDPALTSSRRMFDVILRCLTVGESAVPSRGMRAIPEQLAATLPPGTVRLDTPVRAVAPGTITTAGGETISAERVIVATEGPAASALLGLPAVPSRSVGCVWFAAPAPPFPDQLIALDGTGVGPALNVAVMSNVAPEYAPPGQALIAAACPAVGDADRAGLADAVRNQLRGWWGAPIDRWRHLRTDLIHHAQPDHRAPFGPKQRVGLGDGMFVCGDHRDTPSIQGAMYSGRRTAEAVLASLT